MDHYSDFYSMPAVMVSGPVVRREQKVEKQMERQF